MTRQEFNEAFFDHFSTFHNRRTVWKRNRNYLSYESPERIDWLYLDYSEVEKKVLNFMNVTQEYGFNVCKPVGLVCCGTPCKPTGWVHQYYMQNPPLVVQEQEKEYDMYPTSKSSASMPTVTDLTINMAPAASASVSTKSDVQTQREHLLARLSGIDNDYRWGSKSDELREIFNLDADNEPKTSRELLAAIKDGKFKLDERIADLQDKGNHYDPVSDIYIMNPFGAIKFDGPTPDKDGYTKARETVQNMIKDAKDTIIVKSPEDGLAAIKALEAWTPTGKAN